MNTIIDNCYQDVAPEIGLLPLDKPLHSLCQLPGSSFPEVISWARSIHDKNNNGSFAAHADDLSMCLDAVRIKHKMYKYVSI